MKNLFLDDIRTLRMAFDHTANTIYLKEEWDIVRNYNEFVNYIETNGVPDMISFDHDLADIHYDEEYQSNPINYDGMTEKTGYHCAKWLSQYCIDNNFKLPSWLIHSQNVVGGENIDSMMLSAKKFIEKYKDETN